MMLQEGVSRYGYLVEGEAGCRVVDTSTRAVQSSTEFDVLVSRHDVYILLVLIPTRCRWAMTGGRG